MQLVTAEEPAFSKLWSALWRSAPLRHPWYTPLSAAYQQDYLSASRFIDLSFLAVQGETPVLGVLTALRNDPDGRRELSAFGYPSLFLEHPQAEPGLRQAAERLMRSEIDRIIETQAVDRVLHREWSCKLSPLGHHLMEIGAQATPAFSQWIDLSQPLPLLRRQVRKSYQSLINWGEKNLCLRLQDAETARPEEMERFRLLHLHAAGRETRSRESWERQFEMLRCGEAFLILGEWEGGPVTAALFQHTPDCCYYGVSASRRELFDKPLSHAVLWRAVMHAQTLGCAWFEMGEQRYPQQGDPPPTPKEQSISLFKRGFGGETRLLLDIKWQRGRQSSEDRRTEPSAQESEEKREQHEPEGNNPEPLCTTYR